MTGATIRLDVTNGSGAAYAAYPLARTWSEAQATWLSAATGTAWARSGASGSTDRAAIAIATVRARASGAISVPVDASGLAAIQRWVDAPADNHGLVFAGTSSSDGLAFRSREHGTASSRPRLVVTYRPAVAPPPPQSGVTYHVDSTSGDDARDGKSEATAWRTLAKANAAPLAPGDALVFRRDRTWSGTLTVSRSGTAASPIRIGAYGTGASLPRVTGASTCVRITGSDVRIEGLHADDCSWAGFELAGVRDAVVRSRATRNAAGFYVKSGSTHGQILDNQIVDNDKMSVLTQGGDDDSGAFGVVLHGDHTEIARNTISGCDAFSYDYGRDGGAIEIYGGQYNHIHHNVAIDNDAFTELGNARSKENVFAYNLVRSSLPSSVFLVTRGAASSYGPVLATRAYNNTVYLTGASSQGFVCHAGCGPSILTMRNNVIQAGWKVGYADAAFDEDYDLFWQGQLQFTRGPHTIVAQPGFLSPTSFDLRLLATSPGIDSGLSGLGQTVDLDGKSVPRDGDGDGAGAVDRGAYER